MRILTDTNVLLRLSQQSDPDHQRADAALYALRSQGDEPCVVPQVIYEYWAVCTRPAEDNGLAMTVTDAISKMKWLQQLFPLYRDERAIFDRWENLVTRHDVKGKKTHDARLVAAMLRHGLTHLLTFNGDDFKRFTDISVLTPNEAAA